MHTCNMKLDGVPPGVSSPTPEFHCSHHRHHHHHQRSSESPDSCGRGGGSGGSSTGWVPSNRSETDNIKRRRAYTAAVPHSEPQPNQDRPPMSVVIVRGMPPLPYNNYHGPNVSLPEPAVARIYQPTNCFNGSDAESGSGDTNFSLSSFRLQPRSTVTRSINVRGGIRGRKRSAAGFMSPPSHNVTSSFRAKSFTVKGQHSKQPLHDVETNFSTHAREDYPEVDLGCSPSLLKGDVAIASSPLIEPQSPHVLDSALVTLQSLTLRSPGGLLRSPLHDTMNSPNSIKRPRGSSFSVYHGSPAGSLRSTSSTRAKLSSTMIATNSARSSPRIVPLTVIMADNNNNDPSQNAAGVPSATATTAPEMVKTPPTRPPFIGVKPRVNRESSLDSQRGCMERRAVVSFESPISSSLSASGFGVSPSATLITTPLPRITLTPRSSSSSRDSCLPVLPSTAAFGGNDDDDEGSDKFLSDASPILAPPDFDDHLHIPAASMMLLHDPHHHHYQPRRLVGNERPIPVYQHKRVIVPSPPSRDLKYKASTFQYCGSSNSLALSADGSQDERSQPQQHHHHMSPLDDTRQQFSKSFLPFPNWLDTTSISPRLPTISGVLSSPGTALSPDSGGRIGGGTLDIPTPQRTNCGRAGLPLSGSNEDEPLFGVRTKSLFSATSSPTSRMILQSMADTDIRYTMDAETGSLSDSDEDDEPFVLASPKQIVEERLQAKRARLRLRWTGDVNDTDNLVSNTFYHPSSRNLSLSGTEGASNTSLFGMDIPQDEPSVSATTTSSSRNERDMSDSSVVRLMNPNSVSYTSFLSSATADDAASEPTTLCRRRSDGSLGSLGLSLEIVSANADHMTSDDVAATTSGRDLITPPVLSSSRVTELSPPPFAPKQDPFMFADHEDSPSRNNNNCSKNTTSHGFLAPANRTLVNLAIARMEAAAFDSELDGGVDDEASCDHMTEEMS